MESVGESALERIGFGELARIACKATENLWSGEHGTFWRDTTDPRKAKEEKDGGGEPRIRPTVTFRCAEEMFDSTDAPIDGMKNDGKRLEEMAKAIAGANPDAMIQASQLRYPEFTIALLVAANAKLAGRTEDPKLRAQAKKSKANLPSLAKHLMEMTEEDGEEENSTSPHPFVTFHVIRALQAALRFIDGDDGAVITARVESMIKGVHEETLSLVAKHHLGTITPSESVVLAFCAATLSDPKKTECHKAALAALHAAVAAQDSAGSWPLGRVVHTEPGRLEISTYEVAWAVTRSFERLLKRGMIDLGAPAAKEIVGAIAKAGGFAEKSVVELSSGIRGWASDHPYQQMRVESWTSAIVLQFAIAAADLAEEARHSTVMLTFNVERPDNPLWPDWLRWEKLKKDEPDSEFPIYSYLEKRVVEVIRADSRQLPSGTDKSASVLLFGPPGTSKTTIVQAVADALDWPLVLLNPGVFIEKGLEAIESESRSVFERLRKLRRAVVIFDECDELFRDRSPDGATEQVRNISAFVTASMLPKLQDLHDKGRILFFICTNHVSTMDPAVLRGGRIDHRIPVGPPDRAAREKILNKDIEKMPKPPAHFKDALRELAASSECFSRNELGRAKAELQDKAKSQPWKDADAARDAAKEIANRMKPSLTITKDLYTQFEDDREKYSDLPPTEATS